MVGIANLVGDGVQFFFRLTLVAALIQSRVSSPDPWRFDIVHHLDRRLLAGRRKLLGDIHLSQSFT